MQIENIERMKHLFDSHEGMDVIILSTTNPELQTFWSKRLAQTAPFVLKPGAKVFTVLEDWPKGAGNGLGSLYAFEKACEMAKSFYHMDLKKSLQEGASIALYHTAGQGQRTYPLSLSEHQNKSALKMPSRIDDSLPGVYLTLLEAAIKQTSVYAPSRKGRLSVFWGDQLFIPSASPIYQPRSHIDMLARFIPFPMKEKWEQEGWSNYGLCLKDKTQNVLQVDKINYSTLQKFVTEGKTDASQKIGLSLGCFSLSFEALRGLLALFHHELQHKNKKFDSDPYFWMPLTLDFETYDQLMQTKGIPPAEIETAFNRMQHFAEKMLSSHPQFSLYAAVDIGESSYWWDYGTVKNYYQNMHKLTESSAEADAMRSFFGIFPSEHQTSSHVKKDSHSILIDCEIDSGTISKSVCIGVKAAHVDISNSVLMGVTAPNISAHQALAYQITDAQPVTLTEKQVRSDVYFPQKKLRLPFYTELQRDGKADWNVCLPKNTLSYSEAISL